MGTYGETARRQCSRRRCASPGALHTPLAPGGRPSAGTCCRHVPHPNPPQMRLKNVARADRWRLDCQCILIHPHACKHVTVNSTQVNPRDAAGKQSTAGQDNVILATYQALARGCRHCYQRCKRYGGTPQPSRGLLDPGCGSRKQRHRRRQRQRRPEQHRVDGEGAG
jgi:hypothetical protein